LREIPMRTAASVSAAPPPRQSRRPGNAMLEARLFDGAPRDYNAQRRLWFDKPVWLNARSQ